MFDGHCEGIAFVASIRVRGMMTQIETATENVFVAINLDRLYILFLTFFCICRLIILVMLRPGAKYTLYYNPVYKKPVLKFEHSQKFVALSSEIVGKKQFHSAPRPYNP